MDSAPSRDGADNGNGAAWCVGIGLLLLIGGLVVGAVLQPTAPAFLPKTGSIPLIKRAASWASPAAGAAALGLALVVAGMLRLAALPKSLAYAAALPPLVAAFLLAFGPSVSSLTGVEGVYWVLGLLWPSAIVLYVLAWKYFPAWGLPSAAEAARAASSAPRYQTHEMRGGPK